VYFKKLRVFLDWSHELNEHDVSRVMQIMKQLPEGPETIQLWKKGPRYRERSRRYFAPEEENEETNDGKSDAAP
jgi:hypothetical protein